jgi:hypothetical protein
MYSSEKTEIPGVYTTEVIDNWKDLLAIKDKFELGEHDWLFRGQSKASWELESTFERFRKGSDAKPPWKYEAAILREFTRRAYHYISDLPPGEEVLEWFSLMRYYGAPCRLIDFTYSFYVAAYFALKESTNEELAVVWAVNTNWLKERYNKKFPKNTIDDRKGDFRFKDPKDFRKHFLDYKKPKAFVAPVNPFRLNQRLTAQQGVFLCPGNIKVPFMKNLINGRYSAKRDRILRILVSPDAKREAITDLRRMNITSATLFPDLSGFAQSLSDWFLLPFKFRDEDLLLAIRGVYPKDRH